MRVGARWWGLAVVAVGLAAGVAAPAQRKARLSTVGSGVWRLRADWDYDGKRILGHVGYDVYVWDAQTGAQLEKLVGHKEQIVSVQFSPDGRYALSSSWSPGAERGSSGLPGGGRCVPSKDTSVRLWDLKSGNEVWRLEGQIAGVFSPDGKRLLALSGYPTGFCADVKGAVAMTDVASGRQVFTVQQERINLQTSRLAFSPDGRTFLCDGMLRETANGKQFAQIDSVSYNFYGRDGSIATFGYGGIDVWDSTGKHKRHFAPVNAGLYSQNANWTQDGSWLVAEGWDEAKWGPNVKCQVRVWRVDTGEGSNRYACVGVSDALLVSPHGTSFITGLELMDLAGKREPIALPDEGKLIGFAPDGKTFLSGGRKFTVYSAETGKAVVSFDVVGEDGKLGFVP